MLKMWSEIRVTYTAYKIDPICRDGVLFRLFRERFPDCHTWTYYGDHMTVILGTFPVPRRDILLGQEATLEIDAVGRTKYAVAARVSNFRREDGVTPHITLAVDSEYGRPSMSKTITAWTLLEAPIVVCGVMKECE